MTASIDLYTSRQKRTPGPLGVISTDVLLPPLLTVSLLRITVLPLHAWTIKAYNSTYMYAVIETYCYASSTSSCKK
jgi:hypothetical protein